jgi:hypothetical protein
VVESSTSQGNQLNHRAESFKSPNTIQKELTEQHRQIQRWVLESHRRSDTWLVSKGCILKPPFKVEGKTEGSMLRVKVTGVNDALIIRCNKVVDSPFRDQLGLFFQDKSGAVRESCIVAPFARHFQLILDAFPPNSRFNSEELYAKVTWSEDSKRSQAHARRRWKELKYNYGFDLDWDGKMYWRGPSPVPIREPVLRPDDKRLREEYWAYLADQSCKKYNDISPHCEYCEAKVISRYEESPETEFAGIGLIDHRRPVAQGGDDSIQNLQILCQTCNNIKNSTCRKCPYGFHCDSCVWAYPETLKSRRLVLHLSPELTNALLTRSGSNNLESAVMEILTKATDKRELS